MSENAVRPAVLATLIACATAGCVPTEPRTLSVAAGPSTTWNVPATMTEPDTFGNGTIGVRWGSFGAGVAAFSDLSEDGGGSLDDLLLVFGELDLSRLKGDNRDAYRGVLFVRGGIWGWPDSADSIGAFFGVSVGFRQEFPEEHRGATFFLLNVAQLMGVDGNADASLTYITYGAAAFLVTVHVIRRRPTEAAAAEGGGSAGLSPGTPPRSPLEPSGVPVRPRSAGPVLQGAQARVPGDDVG